MALVLALCLLYQLGLPHQLVLKIPKPLPDIVKSYKSFKVKAGPLEE